MGHLAMYYKVFVWIAFREHLVESSWGGPNELGTDTYWAYTQGPPFHALQMGHRFGRDSL